MRGLLSARGTSIAAVGVFVLLVAGGGYALASGSKTIHACVHKKGGDVYVAKKCAKHDKKLTWNQTGPKGPAGPTGARGATGATGSSGPQGPGATSLVYNASGTASPTRTPIGTFGPWTMTGLCTKSGGSTSIEVDITGPGYEADGLTVLQTGGSLALSAVVPGPVSNFGFGATTPVTTRGVESADAVVFPDGGSPLELLFTVAAVGGTPPMGATANTCHASLVITPVAAPSSSTAAIKQEPAARASRPPTGNIMFGETIAR